MRSSMLGPGVMNRRTARLPSRDDHDRVRVPNRGVLSHLSRKAAAIATTTCLLASCTGGHANTGPAVAATGSWTQVGNAGGHAAWGANGPNPPLRQLWDQHLGGISFGPIVVGGRIVIVSGGVEAVDTRGNVAWSYQPPGGGQAFAPVAIGGLVTVPVLSRGTQELVALQVSSGKVLWQASSPADGASWLWAAADSGRIIVLSNAASPALSSYEADGRPAWAVKASAPIDAAQDNLTPVAVGSGSVVVITMNGLEAYALSNGQRVWAGRKARAEAAPPTIVGGTVIADLGLYPDQLVGYSLATGRRTFSHSFGAGLIWYAVEGKTVYTEEVGPLVAAYTLPGLRPMWRASMSGLNVSFGGELPLAGGILAVALGESSLELHFLGPPSVRPWSMPITHSTPGFLDDVAGEPSGFVPTGGGVVLATIDGGLFAFGPASATP